MPGATAKGVPYVDGATDPAYQWPQTTKDAADFINDKVGVIQSGTVVIPVAGSPAAGSVAVAFATAFPGVPHVVISSSSTVTLMGAITVTAAGFTANARRVDGGGAANIAATWIARY